MRFTTALLIILLLITACQPAPASEGAQPADSLTFMAGYRPQANLPFVGVYVAQEQGFFAEQNLAVTIQHSSGGGEYLQLLAAGEVQISTADAAVVLQRRADPGVPLVALALIGQQGQQAFAALPASGLETVQDWQGQQVGFKGAPPPDLFALLDANGLGEDDVNLVNVGFDPRTLVEGLVEVYPVFKSNEPYLLQQLGYDVRLWEAADYGVPTLGLTYISTEDYLAEHSDIVDRFMTAAMAGIAYARANPAEAVEIVLQYAGEDTDPAHMRYMLETELADAVSDVTEANGPGWQTAAQWQALHDMLLEYDALAGPLDVNSVFTTEYLPRQ